MKKHELKIDWATFAAAQYACKEWHYSGCIPAGKLAKFGAWEDGLFIGSVIFGRGANRNMAAEFGLQSQEVSELVRVALTAHSSETSKILSLSLRLFKKAYSGIRLVVSYADTKQHHVGTIYQATNWIYSGLSQSSFSVFYKNRWMHPRSVNASRGTIKGLPVRQDPKKHRYLMPLDDDMRRQVELLRKPYPKRVTSTDSGVPDNQSGGGGASPTVTLSE